MNSTHDIIIVGGGMVGMALALALQKQTSLSIAILEAKEERSPWSPAHYHHRVSAIVLSSQRFLHALQLWDVIQQKRVGPFTHVHVWDELSEQDIDFASHDIAESLLGFIIENNVIEHALEEKIRQSSQIEWISPIKLAAFQATDNDVLLTTEDGRTFKGKIAVAADGANSWLREKAEIAIHRHDYEQAAIVATVHTSLPHEQIARQVFLKTGPLAFLPLRDANACSIVWTLPTAQAKDHLSLSEDTFKEALANAFSSRLGEIVDVSKRFSFPLYKQESTQYAKSRVVLVGDAAHAVHPLAGQGVNMGFMDSASLSEVIADACVKGRDIAHMAYLRRYERWRKADHQAMMIGIHLIKTIFASDKKIIQELRSFGLNATNQMHWVKNIFIRHAVGNRMLLPRLARMTH